MPTAVRHRSEHGGHRWWLAVLVLAATAGVAVFWTVSRWPAVEQALVEAGQRAGEPVSAVRTSPSPNGAGPVTRKHRGSVRGGPPQHLQIASIDLDAPVVPIGLVGGVLTPPSDPGQIGWWRGGAPAGSAVGTVVLAGHTVHTGGGAMDDLEQVRPADIVRLSVHGSSVRYRVDRVEVLSKTALAGRAATLFGQQGPERLVLVTCENWNGHDYESNVVVTAHPTRTPGAR